MNLDSVLEHHAQVEEFRRRHRTGLATLLFTDIVGSTKLKQTLGDQQGLFLIQQHHSVARKFLGQFKEAEEIKTAGDSFFIIFAKPSDAVKFSLLLQAKLRGLAKTAPAPVFDRIGIHVGEVFIEEDQTAGRSKDLFGIQVDTCARVMSLADGDQILMTRFAFDNARQVLKGQELEGLGSLSWLNHGTYSMKGVEEPLEVCEVGETGLARLLPPVDTEKARRFLAVEKEPVLGWRPAVGQVVPGTHWTLEEKIGEGGFGEVWMGFHQALKRRQVFKFCFRADRVRSLKREVTLFRLLKERAGNHPNIVAVHDVFLNEPPYYLVMDYAEGKDLKTWSQERGGVNRIPLETRLEIVAQVADALQAAHETGVIHRDVKPSNILVEGRAANAERAKQSPIAHRPSPITAKLTDFGIGQVVSEEILAQVTGAGFTQTILGPSSSSQTGTYMYMAPELLAGKPASAQSDLYSLGVVFYQLLVGDFSRPVTTDWAEDVSDPLLRDDLKHCFAGNPQARFERAGELAAHLRSLEERRATEAEREAQESQRREKALREVLKPARALRVDWRQATIGAALSVLLGWFLLISRFDFGLQALSFDLPFALKSQEKPEEALLIYMDDASYRRMQQSFNGPWSRALHTQLLRKLTSLGAKAVVFDVLFDAPWPDPKVDQEFADAMRRHGKVLVAATKETKVEDQAILWHLVVPVEPIRSAAAWGVVDFPADATDGSNLTTIRRHNDMLQRFAADPRNPLDPSLAWKVAEKLSGAPPVGPRRWFNFYGPRDVIPHRSYYEFFETNAVVAGICSNKVVFVGQGQVTTFRGGESKDEFLTPYTRWTAQRLPGVELQATAFLNLWRGDWLTELSPTLELVVFGLTGILFGFGLTLIRPGTAAWTGVLGIFVVAGAAFLLVGQMHVWFPWLIVCAAQIPCALAWSVLVSNKRLHAERELLREAIPLERVNLASSLELAKAQTETTPSRSSVKPLPTPESGLALTEVDSFKPLLKESAAPPTPVIPDHELIRMIGEGGYGQVWLARDVIGTYHAVKFVYRRRFSNDDPYEREFRGLQKFTPISRTHPGLIHILHVGKNDREGYFFYIMELGDDEVSAQKINPHTYSARNLAKELAKRGKLSVLECLELGLALTGAMDHLHRQQLIHRDIKPSNIIFVNGLPKFADVGLVTDLTGKGPATTYVGTEGYIPPEGPGTSGGDIYSLGKVLYECSMGKDRKEYPELPTSLAERADRSALLQLNEVIVKACEQDFRARYQSAATMRDDLLRLQTDWRRR